MQHLLKKYLSQLEKTKNWEQKYTLIIDLGKTLPSIPQANRIQQNLVNGCQSKVWLVSTVEPSKELEQSLILFAGDSDGLITKGLLAMLIYFYSNQTAKHILTTSPTFIKDLGLPEFLTPSRVNGFANIHKKIKLEAFKKSLLHSSTCTNPPTC